MRGDGKVRTGTIVGRDPGERIDSIAVIDQDDVETLSADEQRPRCNFTMDVRAALGNIEDHPLARVGTCQRFGEQGDYPS